MIHPGLEMKTEDWRHEGSGQESWPGQRVWAIIEDVFGGGELRLCLRAKEMEWRRGSVLREGMDKERLQDGRRGSGGEGKRKWSW